MVKDKVAIVTGASSGIGYATALALSKAGAKVAAGARRMDRLELLQSEIIKNGGEVFVQKLDVTIKSECDAFAAAVITPMLNKKSGHIVNISSIAGRIVYPAGSVYCATKHAITAFSEGLRQELSQRS